MKKRLLALAMSLVLSLSLVPGTAFAATYERISENAKAAETDPIPPAYPPDCGIVTKSFTIDAGYWPSENGDRLQSEALPELLTAPQEVYEKASGYGAQLTENQRKIYDTLVSKYVADNGLCGTSTEPMTYIPESGSMYISTYETDVSYAYYAFLYDYPQVFWCGGCVQSCSYLVSTQEVVSITITPEETYANAKADIALYNSGVISAASVIQASVTDTSVYGYYQTIHDWMCQNMSYNFASLTNPSAYPKAHSSSGVFVGNGEVVCQGYGEAFKVLCDYIRREYSIPLYTAIITGTASEDEAHMWNYAYIPGGGWYAIDVCWDDQTSGVVYTYFLCGRISQGFDDAFLNERKEGNAFDPAGAITFTYPVIADDAFVKADLGFGELTSVSDSGVWVNLFNETAGSCIVAVYDESGKMLAVGTKDVAAEAGEVEIAYPQIVRPIHCTVKVFFVDQLNTPVYEEMIAEF